MVQYQDFPIVGDGGAMPVAKELYQALNVFLHCGPRMDSSSLLAHQLKLDELYVAFDLPGFAELARESTNAVGFLSDHEDKETANGRARCMAYWLHTSFLRRWMRMLAKVGILTGHVEESRVTGLDWDDSQVPVRQVGQARVSAKWKHFGFAWGLKGIAGTDD